MKKSPRPPTILRKGHVHVVERDPDYSMDIEMGLIEYEEDLVMTKSLAVGGHVEVLLPFSLEDEWKPAEIIDLLADQFTADVEGHTHFFLYRDKGTTWRQLQEEV